MRVIAVIAISSLVFASGCDDGDRDVRLEVVGSADRVDVTWTDSKGKAHHKKGSGTPWVKTYFVPLKRSISVYVAATQRATGTTTCRIKVAGEVVSENTTKHQNGRTECSYAMASRKVYQAK